VLGCVDSVEVAVAPGSSVLVGSAVVVDPPSVSEASFAVTEPTVTLSLAESVESVVVSVGVSEALSVGVSALSVGVSEELLLGCDVRQPVGMPEGMLVRLMLGHAVIPPPLPFPGQKPSPFEQAIADTAPVANTVIEVAAPTLTSARRDTCRPPRFLSCAMPPRFENHLSRVGKYHHKEKSKVMSSSRTVTLCTEVRHNPRSEDGGSLRAFSGHHVSDVNLSCPR